MIPAGSDVHAGPNRFVWPDRSSAMSQPDLALSRSSAGVGVASCFRHANRGGRRHTYWPDSGSTTLARSANSLIRGAVGLLGDGSHGAGSLHALGSERIALTG